MEIEKPSEIWMQYNKGWGDLYFRKILLDVIQKIAWRKGAYKFRDGRDHVYLIHHCIYISD